MNTNIHFRDIRNLPPGFKIVSHEELWRRRMTGLVIGALAGLFWGALICWAALSDWGSVDPCVDRPGLEVCQGGDHG